MSPLPQRAPRVAPIPWQVGLALFVVQASFSGFHIVGKVVLEVLDPLALAAIRVLFATPLLLVLAWRRDRLLPAWRDLPILALLGLLGVGLNQMLFVEGLARSTATNAAILMPAIPVFAAGLGAVLGIEPVGWRRLVGIGAAVVGALAILDPTAFDLSSDTTLGNLMILGNCLSYALFLVLQRPLLERIPWRTLLAWAFVFGSLPVLAFGGGPLTSTDWNGISPTVAAGIVYILLFPTALGYSLNTWANRRSSPSVVAAYKTLQPLLTAALAVPLLGEPFGSRHLFGMVSILGGLWLVSRRRGSTAPAPDSG